MSGSSLQRVKYRYWRRRGRAVCGTCWALVSKCDVQSHASWHFRRSDLPRAWGEGTDSAFLDVTLLTSGQDVEDTKRTGWLSTSLGPR